MEPADLDMARIKYPRVSDILFKQTERELRSIPIDNLARASLRGTKIHQYCHDYICNLWSFDVEPEYVPYFAAFKLWFLNNVAFVISAGERLYDDEKKFSGEFDLIARLIDGRTALIDIKTSSVKSNAWPLQLAAYHHLCVLNGIKIDFFFNLHLKPKRAKNKDKENSLDSPCLIEYKTIDYPNPTRYWDIFASALACYDYFERKEDKNV